jgi:hypothetical protein
MERCADYSVKPASKLALFDTQILANAWRGRGRDEHVFPASPRLDEEHLGAMLQIQAKKDCRTSREGNSSWLYLVLHQDRSPTPGKEVGSPCDGIADVAIRCISLA